VFLILLVEAQHCQPTLDYGESCTQLSSPYIGKCNFDGAGVALNTLSPSELAPRTSMVEANLQSFSQTDYFTSSKSSLGDVGYLYVPTACQDAVTPCSLHVAFHGCHQDIAEIGNEYAAKTGYNEWAESNNIIVLYPYATVSLSLPSNPNGCWDWWGYTNGKYSVKDGIQMDFVRSIIRDLTGL
jgi:poly(3-hydroxybutyrate) depolymerase